ncbi:2637_t:CDS:10 [Acaulospora morrowiae]|uniref:2637_t:CDS:1 n=1 Tax=Acaulospora morrowiae TaxID=94023 RepID=A0A9N9DIB9_9GLOM|nr:2637_t:CDS:10 [Acaulospora morrowiae]
MAETVQYYLEQMVPELEDLERKGLFTRSEIRAIVKKRTNFEYALKRRPAQKIDFLKYIEYEMNLDQLRKKRKDRLAIRGKVTISDYAITRRIYHIFDRAVIKFKGDVSLWLQYIEFSKSTEAGRAIQMHPTKPVFWILAAKWEYEVNANIVSARVLLQRSIRLNSESTQLWHEYFKLELLYIEKIKARRKILGISTESTESLSEEEKPNTEDVILVPKLNEEEDELLDDQKTNLLKEDDNKLLKGEIVKIIYLNAIKEFVAAVKDSVNEFQQNVKELENKEMWYLFTKFLRRYLFKISEPNLHTYFQKLLSKSYITASKLNLASEQMYADWIDWIVSDSGELKLEEMQEIIKKSTDVYPQSSELWLKRISIAKSHGDQCKDKSLDELYKIALENNPSSVTLWDSYISWIFKMWKQSEIKNEKLEEIIMIASLTLNMQTKGIHADEIKDLVIARYLNWTDETDGLEKTRKVYKSLINEILPSLAFYQTCIKIEQKYVNYSNITSDTKVHLEWLYGQVLQYDKVPDELWLDYIKFLLSNGDSDSDQITLAYERGLKVVSNPEQFKRNYCELRGNAIN